MIYNSQIAGYLRLALLFSISLTALIVPCSFEIFDTSATSAASKATASNIINTSKPISLIGLSNIAAKAGDLDTTFGPNKNGKSVYDISGALKGDGASAAALQPDGKIVAVGSSGFFSSDYSSDFAIVRYSSNGNLDTTFNQSGILQIDIGTAVGSNRSQDYARAVTIQPDGKIVVAGTTTVGSFALLRINSNGTLDTSFGSNGIVVSRIDGAYLDNAFVQPDGKIVAVGWFINNSNNDFAIVRYNDNGSLDTSFDSDGIVRTDLAFGSDQRGRPIPSIDRAYAAALLPDGNIVVVGTTRYENYSNNGCRDCTALAVVRYNSNGGFEAKVRIDLDGKVALPDVVIQSDGKILASASFSKTSALTGTSESNFTLVRLDSNLTFDSSFGNGGIVINNFGCQSILASAVAVQPDGKIVLAGDCRDTLALNSDFILSRFYSDGSLDIGFARLGFTSTDFFGEYDSASDVIIQPDGKIVIAGSARYTVNDTLESHFAIARYFGSDSIDFTPPVLTIQDSVTTEATSPTGAQVNYTVTVTDNLDPNPTVNCTIPSGRIFSIGTTVVTCTATDASGNSASKTFQIVVKSAAEQLNDLIDFVNNLNLAKTPANKLDHGLDKVQNALQQGDMKKACGELDKFIKTVQRESGRKLTLIEARRLLDAANRISMVQGC